MPRSPKEKREKLRTGSAIQILGLAGAFGLITLNQFTEPDADPLFIWAMFGLAYGARPETFNRFFGSGK